jgi:hypothetical protein
MAKEVTSETDEIDEIEKDMKLSGFPLEIEATAVLKKNGWHVRNQVYYLDKDEGKPRSIDIVVHKAFYENYAVHDRLHVSLIIECKKSVKPWVFFTSPKKGQPLFELPFSLIKNFAAPKLEQSLNVSKWMQRQMHYTSLRSKHCAIISYEPFKQGKGQEVLEATHQVTKALGYFLEGFKKAPTLVSMKPAFVLFPVIVFDGHMFECELQNGDLKLSRNDYTQYFVEMEQHFLIDVVGKCFLPEYLKLIDEDIKSLKEALG